MCLPVSSSERTKVVVIQGDITDYSSVLEASRGADVVIHTASLVDVWHRVPETLIYSVNVTGEIWGVVIPLQGSGVTGNVSGFFFYYESFDAGN